MRLSYQIFWADILVAKIFQKRNGKLYYAISDIKTAQKAGMPVSLIYSENGKIPAFIKSRLESNPDCDNDCKTVTDSFTIKKIKPRV